jgi:hypothetical protein
LAKDKKHKATKGRLNVHRVINVPLREVSGVCLRRGRRGEMSLVAIGDRVAVAAWVRLPSDESASLDWQTIDITRLAGSRLPKHDPQIEAVCADGAGRVLLLQESPPRAELVDLAASRIVASIALEVPGKNELAESWSDPKGSRGEGAAFLRNGHLLVAKEKHPRVLIEFGPRGVRSQGLARGAALASGARWQIAAGVHRYIALAVWWPDKTLAKACKDFSDLEVGPDGCLYLLSDKSKSIARLDDLPRGGGTVTLTKFWRIRDLSGKPEGLAFTAKGRAIVALDTRKARHNLVVLDPEIAARSRG